MKRILYPAVLGASMLLLPSCSLFNKASDGGENGSQAAVTSKKSNTGSSSKSLNREAIVKAEESGYYSPEEFTKGILKGRWSIEKVFGNDAVGEKVPRIEFAEAKKEFFGNNGCNSISGEYEYDAATHTLRFNNVAVSMMLCHLEGITDTEINRALNDTRYYTLQEADDGYTLFLLNDQHEKIMSLSNQNFEFLNGSWKVVKIDGQPIDNDKMRLVFDIPEKKVHGNTGCNVLNGKLQTNTEPETPNSISFEEMAVTMMLCPEMEHQSALLYALEDACRAKPIDKTHVEFFNSSGQAVLTLEKISLR